MACRVAWLLMITLSLGVSPRGALAQPPAPPAPALDALPVAPEPSPLLKEPQTPEEAFAAVVLLVDLARFDLAQAYLKQYVASNPSDEQLQQLRDRYGTGEFLRLTQIAPLRATALPLLARLNEASRKQAADPAYIEGLIARLSGTPAARELAIRELQNAGPAAVPILISRLRAAMGTQRDVLVIALSRLGEPVIPVLIAALDAPEEGVQVGSLEALSRLGARAAVPRMWRLAFDQAVPAGTQDAARRALSTLLYGDERHTDRLSGVLAVTDLERRARQYLTREVIIAPDEQSDVTTVWAWNTAQQAPVSALVKPEDAALDEALRLAGDALALSPETRSIQTLYLTAVLSNEVRRQGWDATLTPETNPLMGKIVASGVDRLQETLSFAMEQGRSDAAWGALQGLSSLASPILLTSTSAEKAPVLRALNYPDPRVQFAAAMVVLRSDPPPTLSRGSRVTEILRRSLTDPGQPQALIIDPDQAEATQIGSYLSEDGYETVQASTGREGFRIAAERTGIQLIVVQANVGQWPLTMTLSNLRADARTAYLPIVVYGPEDVRVKIQRLVQRTGNAVFAAESPGSASFWEQVRPLLGQMQSPPPSPTQRADFKALAAYWLATLAEGPLKEPFQIAPSARELFPLVQDPKLSPQALAALGRIGTEEVQRYLTETVLADQLAPEIRRQAAVELTGHIQRHGLVIATSQTQQLTSLWQSTDDAELKGRLATVVGTFRPDAALVGERLRQLQTP